MTDEGLGLQVIRKLKDDTDVPDSVTMIEAGTPGLSILSILEGYSRAIVVDIAQLGGKPGTVYVLSIEKQEPKKHPLNIGSMHEVDFISALELGWSAGLTIPTQITVIAVEPKDYRSFGLELTSEVSEAVPLVVKEIRRQLATVLNTK